GPVTRSPSRRWLRRSASSVSFPPRMRPKLRRFLTFPPVGLSPTEHASLSWTHWLAKTASAFTGETSEPRIRFAEPDRVELISARVDAVSVTKLRCVRCVHVALTPHKRAGRADAYAACRS